MVPTKGDVSSNLFRTFSRWWESSRWRGSLKALVVPRKEIRQSRNFKTVQNRHTNHSAIVDLRKQSTVIILAIKFGHQVQEPVLLIKFELISLSPRTTLHRSRMDSTASSRHSGYLRFVRCAMHHFSAKLQLSLLSSLSTIG
jgi:hypothetical protein